MVDLKTLRARWLSNPPFKGIPLSEGQDAKCWYYVVSWGYKRSLRKSKSPVSTIISEIGYATTNLQKSLLYISAKIGFATTNLQKSLLYISAKIGFATTNGHYREKRW